MNNINTMVKMVAQSARSKKGCHLYQLNCIPGMRGQVDLFTHGFTVDNLWAQEMVAKWMWENITPELRYNRFARASSLEWKFQMGELSICLKLLWVDRVA